MQVTESAIRGSKNCMHQGLVVVDRGPRGGRLRQPIILENTKNLSARDTAVREYVVDALCWKMPALIYLTFQNKTMLKLATHLYTHTTGSRATLYQYIYGVHRFLKWLERNPDDFVQGCQGIKSDQEIAQKIEAFIGDMKAEQLAPGTIANHVKSVKALLKVNNVHVTLPYKVDRKVKYSDRAPTPKELEKITEMADLREKTIISILALSGMRIGTLVKLRYRHVKKDLEAGIIPVHIHVEADITKGKYHDYDTFLGEEAVEYLKAYLKERRQGTWYMSPEEIQNDSPLIRDEHSAKVRPLSEGSLHRIIHALYARAGLINLHEEKRRYELRPHSIRKYFRTQMGSIATMPTDYIEYMMGHSISTYNDVQNKDTEFLRSKYAMAGLRIRQKEKADIYDFVEDVLKSKGYSIDTDLLRRAIVKPHRTVYSPLEHEEDRKSAIRSRFMEMLRKEFLKPNLEEQTKEPRMDTS